MTRPGIQRVTHAELLDAGVDLTGKPVSEIGIADNGRAVSRYVDDANGNEVFDAGDAIEFVGDVELTLYSDANLYVLTSDGSKVADARELAPSARGDAARTYTASYRAYPDNRYSASAPVGSIPWYDGLVRAIGKPSQLARTFDLPDLDAAASAGATLTVDLWGLSDLPGADDHHAVVSLNGVEIADTRFDGLVLDRVSVDLDPGILRAAGNELVVYLPFDIGAGRASTSSASTASRSPIPPSPWRRTAAGPASCPRAGPPWRSTASRTAPGCISGASTATGPTG